MPAAGPTHTHTQLAATLIEHCRWCYQTAVIHHPRHMHHPLYPSPPASKHTRTGKEEGPGGCSLARASTGEHKARRGLMMERCGRKAGLGNLKNDAPPKVVCRMAGRSRTHTHTKGIRKLRPETFHNVPVRSDNKREYITCTSLIASVYLSPFFVLVAQQITKPPVNCAVKY